ncbi:hypothetical protein HDU81_002214 [Chytriomyces hyalinus]|nr:hypothetical protein HDU81_002214 [Chytriomyces hyalinus]
MSHMNHPLRRAAITASDTDSEERRMLAGELYYGFDPVLAGKRDAAKKLWAGLNKMDECVADDPARIALLQQLFGSMGEGAVIESPFRCDYGKNIYIGRNVYFNFGATILDCNRVDIGDNCLFGPNVCIYAAYHPTDPDLRTEWGPELAKPVRIGNDVWVGGSAIILHGVTIGDGATVGAGAVVTKDVPARTVVVGNPARVVKHV